MVHNEKINQDFIDLKGMPFFLKLFCITILLARMIPPLDKLYKRRLGSFSQHDPVPVVIPPYYFKQVSVCASESMPKFSIVTPSFNQVEYIEATIQSVLSQDYPKLEYVIKDGSSTDGSISRIEKYRKNLKWLESCSDSGQANAINLGFSHTKGEIMAYINSDDLYLPGTIHYVARFFTENPDIDVVFGHRIIIDETGDEIGRWIVPPYNKKVLCFCDYIPQETLFWRKRIWQKVGGFIDESYKYALDWELLLRFQKADAKFQRLPRFLGAFRVHKHQKTRGTCEDIGQQEMRHLRMQCHGREITIAEITRKTIAYQLHALALSEAHRCRLLRY